MTPRTSGHASSCVIRSIQPNHGIVCLRLKNRGRQMTATIARRQFIAALGGAAAWPLAARAQQDDRVRALQMRVLRLLVESTADKISQFIPEIETLVGWTTQLPWSASTIDQRRFDGLRLLRHGWVRLAGAF